jgi:hypothetical protein
VAPSLTFHVLDNGNPLVALHCLAAANLGISGLSSFSVFGGMLSLGQVVGLNEDVVLSAKEQTKIADEFARKWMAQEEERLRLP